MKIPRRLGFAMLLVLAADASLGQTCTIGGNLLVNPDLDASPAGWASMNPALAVGWNGGFDSDGNACSGALAATLSTPTPLSTIGGQCVSGIADSSIYDFGGRVLVALGEPADGSTTLWLYWFDDLGCTGAMLGTSTAPGSIPPPHDEWVEIGLEAVDPPAGAESVGFALVMIRTVGGGDAYSALFDDLYLRPSANACDDVFDDGFESTDTGCWSAAVP